MSDARQWHALVPRVLSGVAIRIAGTPATWIAGWVFTLPACPPSGLMSL